MNDEPQVVDATTGGRGEPDGQEPIKKPVSDVISRDEFRKVVGQRDRWKSLVHEKDSELELLREQLNGHKKDDKKKTEDDSIWTRKVEGLESQLKEANDKLHRVTIEREATRIAEEAGVIRPKLFLMHYRDRLESVISDDGETSIRVKNSGLSITDLVDEFLENYPELKVSNRKPGAGQAQKDTSVKTERTGKFSSPDEAREFLKTVKLGL